MSKHNLTLTLKKQEKKMHVGNLRNIFKHILIGCTCLVTTALFASDIEEADGKHRSKRAKISTRSEITTSVLQKDLSPTQPRQYYGIPTYDALFKHVLDKPSLQPSFFHALAGLDIKKATRIDEHMNPLRELEHLRTLINDDKTLNAVNSLQSKQDVSVTYQGKVGRRVHKGFTDFVQAILPYFEDLRRAFPRPPYDGTMDFVCKLSNGEYAMVEMQVIPYDDWDRRALGYVAAFYGKQMREGDKWKSIKKVIGINILGGGRDGLEHWKDAPSEYVRHYKMQEQLHKTRRYIDGIEIIQYSLMHLPKELDDREQQDWLTFFKEASRMTEDDVRARITTPAVLEAFERAKLSTLPDQVRERYAMEESQYSHYSIHTKEQIDEGIQKGRTETLCTLIQRMKNKNKSDKKIRRTLGLSEEEYESYIRLISDQD